MDAPLLADRDESASTSAANIGRMGNTEDNVISIAEGLAGNRFGVRKQYVPNIPRSRLFVPVSDSSSSLRPFLIHSMSLLPGTRAASTTFASTIFGA